MNNIPKLIEFTIEELQEQLENQEIDKEFLIEYIVKRDKAYNQLIDKINELRIQVSSREEVAIELQKRIEKVIENNEQIIKDTKDFYRPTSDRIYSGDCLIELAENNISILKGE